MLNVNINSIKFMLWLFIMVLTVLGCSKSYAITKIAVIDTGFDFKGKWAIQPKLCVTGHKDFTGTGLQDNHGHGTHIAGLIAKYAAEADYCIIILKFYDPSQKDGHVRNSTASMNYAIDQKVDIINFSGGGIGWNHEERIATVKALNAGIKVIAAAGNERSSLKVKPFYPALYDGRVVVVGAIDTNNKRIPASNYGPQIDVYEQGYNVLSILPNNSYGYMTGTSQATAIHTGKIVNKVYKIKKLYDYVDPKIPKKTYISGGIGIE